MRRYLSTAPLWVVTTVSLVLYVVWLTIAWQANNDPHDSWLSSFVFACLSTAITAPFFWRDIQRSRDTRDSITGPLTPEQKSSVYRAAAKGVPPTDPALRQAALDLARYRLDKALRDRKVTFLVGIGGVAFCAVVAVFDRSLWFAFCAVIIAEVFVEKVGYPSRQRRRIARLDQPHVLAS